MKKILIIRTDGIGDLLLVTPLIKALKEKLHAHVAVLAADYAAPVLFHNPDVDEIIAVNPDKLSGVLKKIKEDMYSEAILVFPRFSTALLAAMAKIPERTGTAYRWYSVFLFTRKVRIHRKENRAHEADYNLMLAEHLVGKREAEKIYYYSRPDEDVQAGEYLVKKAINGKFIIIYPGGKGTSLNLSAEKYARIIDRLAGEYPSLGILIGSGKGEQEMCAGIMKKVKSTENIRVMEEDLSIRQLAAVIKRSQAFVSGSTGPMHIAAAVNVKTVTFFPSFGVSPVRWKPLGNQGVIIKPAGNAGMDTISSAYVADQLKILMDKG